jgi:hypothetical protein
MTIGAPVSGVLDSAWARLRQVETKPTVAADVTKAAREEAMCTRNVMDRMVFMRNYFGNFLAGAVISF